MKVNFSMARALAVRNGLFLLVVVLGICSRAGAAQRPNVVVVLTDDQGWGDLGINGNHNLQTPHIDALARDGVRFDRFYVCPVCSPTRAEFLTGRYHPRGGVYSTSRGGERLDLDEQTIADVFREAGYATGAFGKWHNGMQYPYHPNGRGFQEFYGFCSGHWGHYFSPMLEHNGQLVQGRGYVIDDFTDHAMTFMEDQVRTGKPFFTYLAYNTPHSPMQVPDVYWERFAGKSLTQRNRNPKQENLDHTRAALAMCENIDWNVGRLLHKLDDLKVADNTIFIYFSDNGPNGWRWNDGMRGRKGSTDEGGVRSPLLMRWPGHLTAGKKVTQISGAIDLLPTLAGLAGVTWKPQLPLDGLNIEALVRGTAAGWPDRILFSHWNNRVSARTGRFRLDHRGRLYDLAQDPGQDHDVSQEHRAVQKRLADAVVQWRREVLSELGEDNRPLIVGHPDYPITQLPARDATPHGSIERSNKYPNDSYFTHWIDTNDAITWPVEVGATGDYRVDIYYTCPAEDVGSKVVLRFNESVLEGWVSTAHDPPLKGAQEDRTPRGESYVKDFRPMTLGSWHLQKGQGEMRLQAVHVAQHQVMDFRLLLLTRVDP